MLAADPVMSVCLVWIFDELTTAIDGAVLLSEFECPLLSLSSNIHSFQPLKITKSISVAHLCDTLCCMVGSKFCHNYIDNNNYVLFKYLSYK